VPLVQWGLELIEQLEPIARTLDATHGGTEHADAVAHARAALQAPDTLPSARVLQAMHRDHHDVFVAFAREQSLQTHARLLALPWSAKQQARYEAMAAQSLADQRAIEAADTMPFEIYRQEYTSPHRLGRPQEQAHELVAWQLLAARLLQSDTPLGRRCPLSCGFLTGARHGPPHRRRF
jgi:glutamate--cysteine ligase